MSRIRFELRLEGPGARGARVDAVALRDLLGTLIKGNQRALRLRVEGRSTAKGQPAWMRDAASFDVIRFDEGSTLIELEAPSLGECLPHWFRSEVDAFTKVDPSQPAVVLLQQGFAHALERQADSPFYDGGIVDVLLEFSELRKRGFERVEFRTEGRPTLSFSVEDLQGVEELRRRIPPPQRVRVAGVLNQLRHSDRFFTLVLPSQETLDGVAGEIPESDLARLWGKQVVVSGLVVFRISGKPLRIEAERIDAAHGDQSLWAVMPSPVFGDGEVGSLRRPQARRTGINAIVGEWPGDETDEEIAQLLEEMS